MISQGRIADELALAGNEVVNLEPDFLDIFDKFAPCTHCRRWPVTGLNNKHYKEAQNENSDNIFSQPSFWGRIFSFDSDPHQDEYTNLCEEIVTNHELIKKLEAENFDAYFGEHVHLCGMGLAHLLKIPHKFWISSCTMGISMRNILGVPTPSSFLPFMSHLDETPAPIWQRAKNFLLLAAQNRDEYRDNDVLTRMYRRHFGEHFPSIESIAKDSDFVFVSTDELLEVQVPTLNNIVHIGGLGVRESIATLDNVIVGELEKGEKGVVLFSLGTIANTTRIPPRIIKNFLDITQQFKEYHFIVKVDKTDSQAFENGKNLKNVFVTDWVNQPGLLAHDNTKLFITHAGYNSLMESARFGVPVLTLPFMFDQPRNSRFVERKGWGLARDKLQLADEPQVIADAIREIFANPSYRQKATKLKNLMKSKPQTASERLVKTTMWVLDNGGIEELRFEGRNLDSITYYNIDIFASIIATVAFVFIILRFSSYFSSEQKEKKD